MDINALRKVQYQNTTATKNCDTYLHSDRNKRAFNTIIKNLHKDPKLKDYLHT